MSKRKGDHHYHNKVPPFTPDQRPELKAQGYVAYQCKTCQKWHVGRVKEK